MATLATADGRLLRQAAPGTSAGSSLNRPLPPLWWPAWTDQSDAYGYHNSSGLEQLLTFEACYATFPAVYAVVNKIVREVSRTPLKVYRQDADGDKQRVYPWSNDPLASLANLLERPARRKSSADLKQWIALPLVLNGNSLLAKWRGEGPDDPPTELLPFEWQYVTGYAPPGGEIEVWGTTQLGDRERYLAADDAVHFAFHAPAGRVGVGALASLRDALLLENAAVRTQRAIFRRGVRISGFVIPGDVQQVNRDALREMREQVEAMHAGPDNAGGIAALAPGGNFLPLTFDSREAELMASRVFNRVDVCMAYDVKPPVVGAIENANYASIREINQDFYRTTLPPWLNLTAETIKAQLIDPEPSWQGGFVEFDLKEQLRGDPLQEAQRLGLELDHGLATINEGRSVLNRVRIEDPRADEPWLPMNNLQPMSGAGPQDSPEGQAPSPNPPTAGAGPREIQVVRDAEGRVVSYKRID